jgi:hypothetical protein
MRSIRCSYGEGEGMASGKSTMLQK